MKETQAQQRGFSLVELLTVLAILAVFAAIAVPSLIASRQAANEASAQSALRSIHGAQAAYQVTTGSGRYSTTLAALGTADLLDESVAAGTKNGYDFTIPATAAPAPGRPAQFCVQANPRSGGGSAATGTRVFGLTEDGIIRGERGTDAKTTRAEILAMPSL